jgi:hypothetical protein
MDFDATSMDFDATSVESGLPKFASLLHRPVLKPDLF